MNTLSFISSSNSPIFSYRYLLQPTFSHIAKSRSVLVAKCLTNSDASSGRIILPRVAVEANLPFVTAYRHYALAVRDNVGRRYEFVIKSWANGTEHRRVFVLEQASDFMRAHGIGMGDTVGICSDEYGDLVVEANTEAVRQATICPRYGAMSIAAHPAGGAAATAAVPLTSVMAGRCARSVHCTKAAGHPGFCSGPRAAAAAAAAAAQAHAAGAAAAARYRRKVATPSLHLSPFEITTAPSIIMEYATYSSDEMAATTTLPLPLPPVAPTPSPPVIYLPDESHLSLPPGLHTIAYIPTGLRISKDLTAYDLSSKRIILPAEDLDEGIPNALECDVFTLAAVDESQGWHFPSLKAWNSVTGRRGYLLEGTAAFLAARGAVAGDKLVVYRDTELTPPRIEVRAGGAGVQIRRPSVRDANVTFSQLPMLLHPKEKYSSSGSVKDGTALTITTTTNTGVTNNPSSGGGFSPGTTEVETGFLRVAIPVAGAGACDGGYTTIGTGAVAGPMSSMEMDPSSYDGAPLGPGAMVCNRTGGCTKAAGHQGFCSGHKGFKRREGTPTATQSGGMRNPLRQQRLVTSKTSSLQYRTAGTTDDEGDVFSWDSDDDYTPGSKRVKRGSAASTPRGGDPLLSLLSLLDG